MTTKYLCSICQMPNEGFGNNAEPINDGRCCDSCNALVILARLNLMMVRRATENRPVEGKQYALTGGKDTPCIANGNTWAESEVKKPVKEQIGDFVTIVQSLQEPEGDVNYRKITAEHGKKYSKIVETTPGGGRSVYCFIDLANGNVLKAASWRTPHPIPRANIYDSDGGRSGITKYGAKYMDALSQRGKMRELKK